MRLFSWNVNGLRAVTNRGDWQKFITEAAPDVVGLQEIKAKADQIDEAKRDDYYHYINAADRAGYAGTAIFSKLKPENIIYDIPEAIADHHHLSDTYGNLNREGRVIVAEFTKFFFITVYTPNVKHDLTRLKIRQAWDAAFLTYIKQLERQKPVIICGDMNVAHQEIDLARPKDNIGNAGFTDEERAGFQNYLNQGLIDTFRQLHPEQTDAYTWWTWRANARARNVGWRIDYFLTSQSLHSQILSATIHNQQTGSDHCPVSLELEFK